jgi:hypothetical protein
MLFLPQRDPRALTLACPDGIRPVALYLGAGNQPVEVAVLASTRRVTNPELRQLHAERLGKRTTPVVIVALLADGRAALAGPAGAEIALIADADATQVERLCEAALAAPDRHAALRFLANALGQLDAPIPGLRNSGLFALHELQNGVPGRPDWHQAGGNARAALAQRGRRLIEQLGFSIQDTAGPAAILIARNTKVAIALFLERADEIEAASPRFDNASPITHALAKADQENLDYVVVAAGSTLRVYPVKTNVGTGRRGRAETFVELNLDLLRDDQAAYLWLLCSADALAAGGSFTDILAMSADYAANLGERLRERVYEDVVPRLSTAIVRARKLRTPSAERLRETYEMALLVLFRLLFVAYAEDKGLLPLHLNAEYRRHSLKELAKRLAEARAKRTPFEDEDFYWTEVGQLWKAVDRGNKTWAVPPYNGGLFAAEDGAGAALEKISLTDAEFAPALAALLLERTGEGGEGPIDFRSLGVREFGTIYEGLLESELSVAETDLAVDPKTKAYVPAKGKATVEVHEGDVYLHNASGARKSSGAYYTKDFAVEHLLEKALEPALDDHLARVGGFHDAREAAAVFFDFRVADIAMGSGHFLVAAIDHIERRLSNFLAARPLPGVTDELERLRSSALEALGKDWLGDPIEDTQLLRRQIARRCIFGVDLNPLAVELARLSIWIHTFVPGLPLSFLDANLVIGNSLVGIATFEEAAELIGANADGDLFAFAGAERLHKARGPIERLARLAEATAAEVKEAKKLFEQAGDSIRGEANLLTVLAASRIDDDISKAVAGGQVATKLAEQGDVFSDALVRRAEKALAGLQVLHFPIAFPQVFLGRRGGFDVILGNPPWEKAHVEEHEFWARHYPGFRGVTQAERETQLPRFKRARPDLVARFEEERAKADGLRALLLTGPYPGMGSGHPDLYKAFCWRFWHLAAPEGGRIGVVLPRSALAAKGGAEFRLQALLAAKHVEVTMLLNNKQWMFPEVHPQYTIALVSAARGATVGGMLELRGPYASLHAYRAGAVREPVVFPAAEVRSWNESAALPLLPSEQSAVVFTKLRRSPRFDQAGVDVWVARPLQGDLNATVGRPLMDFDATPDETRWPVYGGESFDLWTPDTGKIYAVADAKKVCEHLQERRVSSARNRTSAFAAFQKAVIGDPATLPCRHARIAFRDVSRATDTRTVRACLIPPELFLVHNAPFLLWPCGDNADEAYMLGTMCSLPFDWYARRFVETHLTFDFLTSFPVPAAERASPLRKRVVDCAGQLASQDRRFTTWAKPLGLKPRKLAADEQADLIAELDAAVAHLYGLAEADLVHIFETFHEGWDYQDRLDATLKHFARLRSIA